MKVLLACGHWRRLARRKRAAMCRNPLCDHWLQSVQVVGIAAER